MRAREGATQLQRAGPAQRDATVARGAGRVQPQLSYRTQVVLAEHGTVQQRTSTAVHRADRHPATLASGNEWRRVEGPPMIHTAGGP